MAFSFGFYNSSNQDRRYDATQMGALFDGLIIDGVFQSIGNCFRVTPGSGLQVRVDTGKAWFNHTWNVNDSFVPLTIQEPDVYFSRIDAVVIEVDGRKEYRQNALKVVKGTPASSPQRPPMANDTTLNYYQHPLAYVTVAPRKDSITNAEIEIVVGKAECPFVTGVVKTANISSLFDQWTAQWSNWYTGQQTSFNQWKAQEQSTFDSWMQGQESAFTKWWDEIKATLDTQTVTRMENQIMERVRKTDDKASDANMTVGTTVDDKYVTPAKVKTYANNLRVGSTAVATAGTDNTNFMTSLRTKEAIDARNAQQGEITSGSNAAKFVNPSNLVWYINQFWNGKISYGTAEYVPGSTTLATGAIYIAYE